MLWILIIELLLYIFIKAGSAKVFTECKKPGQFVLTCK